MITDAEFESAWDQLLVEHRLILETYLASLGTSRAPTAERILIYFSELVSMAALAMTSVPPER